MDCGQRERLMLRPYEITVEGHGSAEAEALFHKAKPIFAGYAPQVTGTALMQLVALWLAGFQPEPGQSMEPERVDEFRVDMMSLFLTMVIELTPMMEEGFVREARMRGVAN